MTPGIVKLYWDYASKFPDKSFPIAFYDPLEEKEICLSDTATISEEISFMAGVQSVKTILSFTSEEDLPLDRRIGFIAVDAEGNKYLVGNKPPHCGVLTRTAETNKPSESPSFYKYSFEIPFPKYKYER